MSKEQLKAFLKAVKLDVTLQEKLKAVADADAVLAIAKAGGFMISGEELATTVGYCMLSSNNFELYKADILDLVFNFRLEDLDC